MTKERELYDQMTRLQWHSHSQDEITNQTGWIPSPLTWTYASASSFTVTGDVTAILTKGTYLKFDQTTTKYAVVRSSSYSSPNTTVNIIVNTDYTIANAEITSPYYSYAANPQGWPGWFNWSPTLTGFSANPTGALYRYSIIGRTVYWVINQYTDGTSNGTTFEVSLPIIAGTAGISAGIAMWGGCNNIAKDNGSNLTVASRWNISTGASTVQFFTDMSVGVWTASGAKRVRSEGFYEF